MRQHGTRLKQAELDDLQLWCCVLDWAVQGIDLNLLNERKANVGLVNDARLYQIGGYDLESGPTWHWALPQKQVGLVHINFLEFVGSVFKAELGKMEGRVKTGDCVASGGDSASVH